MTSTQLTLPTRDIGAPAARVAILHINEIAPDSTANPRYEREQMTSLTSSFGRRGQLQNVNVIERAEPDENGRLYDLVAGRSRYASVRALYESGAHTGEILAMIHPVDADARGIALTENLQRVQMKPGELAFAIREYADELDCSDRETAELLGIGIETVREYLRLARTLPSNAIRKLNSGGLTKAAAMKLMPLADKAPDLVAAVIEQAGEGIAASEIAANPDLVVYEAVRDRRVGNAYAEPFTGGLDVLDAREVLTRATAELSRTAFDRTVINEAEHLARELGQRDPGERVAHVEPSEVHRVAQTAPEGAIVDLDTRVDTDGEVLSRAVVCTSPALMLEWGIAAAKRILQIAGPRSAEDEQPTTLKELEAEAIATIKTEARDWNRVLSEFCAAIATASDGCDQPEAVTQVLLGCCYLPGRLLVGQGLGHVRGDWRTDAVAVKGGEIETREKPPLGAEEAQRRHEDELLEMDVAARTRLTVAAVVAGALCDTREVGARERARQLAAPPVDDTPRGSIALAIAALADGWEHSPDGFCERVRTRLEIADDQQLMTVDPSSLKRRARA